MIVVVLHTFLKKVAIAVPGDSNTLKEALGCLLCLKRIQMIKTSANHGTNVSWALISQ